MDKAELVRQLWTAWGAGRDEQIEARLYSAFGRGDAAVARGEVPIHR